MKAHPYHEGLLTCVSAMKADATFRQGLPPEVVATAANATLKRLAYETYDARLERRARAYFRAVLRRALVRTASAADASARLVLATVVADLAEAGRSPEAVWNELVRGWSDKVPVPVLEEYRRQLCA